MKNSLSLAFRVSACAAILHGMTLSSSMAVVWDPDEIVNGTYGGSGTWNTSLANWGSASDGTGTDGVWASGTADFLRNSSGTVNLGTAISASRVNFGTAGIAPYDTGSASYTLTGSALTLTAAASTTGLAVTNSSTATFQNQVRLGTSLRMSVAGTLSFDGGLHATAGATPLIWATSGSVNFGNLTRSTGTFNLSLGATSGSSTANYNFNGDGSGLNGTLSISRGVAVANTDTAFGAGSISLAGASSNSETQKLMIGTSGVTISRNITFGNNTTDDAGDVREIGSTIATGTATYSGNVAMRLTGGRLSAAAGGTTRFSGVVSDNAENRAILVQGGGTVELAGANTYGGNTTVNAGATLKVSNTTGSATGTGSLIVSGTLAGGGAISGGVTLNNGSTISPGNSPGTLSTGAETWMGGATYLWEINDAAGGTAGGDPGWDRLLISGNLDITATTLSKFNIEITSLTTGNTPGSVADFVDGTGYTFLIADSNAIVSTFDPSAFNLDLSGFTNSYTGTWAIVRGDSIGQSNTDLYLTYTPVPEPSTLLLMAIAGAVIVLRRRRS